MTNPIDPQALKYLQLLAQQYPSINSATNEIIRLNARLNLPKGTEHFISDIHGEYEAFLHVLRNGSGSIRRQIDEIFADSLSSKGRRTLATLIYYPEQKLPHILKEVDDREEWYHLAFYRLLKLGRRLAAKYTRAEVRHALPADLTDIIEELFQEPTRDRQIYTQSIIDSIVSTEQADRFIISICNCIQRLAIAHLHIIGDIFDRGPGAHIILDKLLTYHSLDIQWGNHDIVWMGAAAGSDACIANVIRISIRYTNMETLENGYGISLIPLASLAMEVYAEDLCNPFMPKMTEDTIEGAAMTPDEQLLLARMQKAISIIQFKLEGQIVQRRPHYKMDDRLLLDKINYDQGTITIEGQEYELTDTYFPTIDPADPYALSSRERQVVERLRFSFLHSEKLQKHIRFLYAKGSMYQVVNNTLLYHGCIAMNEDGSFGEFYVNGESYGGKAFMDRVERLARQGYFSTDPDRKLYGLDAMWYLWSGPNSPLYGKYKMATFERYFIKDKATHKEEMNAYYKLRDNTDTAVKILDEFGLQPDNARIINGHVPVMVKTGESPIKADGKLIVIDGGFAKAYQSKTGIAGYTLISNSYGFLLSAHEPFDSMQEAIHDERDIDSETRILDSNNGRIRVHDTDEGRQIQQRITALGSLVEAYRTGIIKETSAEL